jgi:hypothetical protein
MNLKLPQPGAKWSPEYQQRVNQTHEASDTSNRKKTTDVEVGLGQKLVLRDSTGARWEITVSTGGAVAATAL